MKEGLGRIGRSSGAGNLGLVADTIRVEVHHNASQGSPDPEENLGVQIADWAVVVHRDCSRVGMANVGGIVEAVAVAADSGSFAGLALSVVGWRKPVSPAIAFVQTQQL